MNVKFVVHEAEEGGFWAEVPALPGCASQGETMDGLLANIREAIQGWLDTEPSATPASPSPDRWSSSPCEGALRVAQLLRGPDNARPAGMHVERERSSEVGGSGYIRTINGVQVFRGNLELGTSLLIPRELISEISYFEEEGGRVVHAVFKQPEGSNDPCTGYIEFSFRQSIRLHDQAEVIEISYPPEAGYGEDRG